MKRALITGVTGQDGAYLAELLISKGYEVHGIKRRASLFNTNRIDHLYQDPHETDRRLILHHGDMTDATNLIRIIQTVQPDEIYNLAAQSHVAVSFETPEYTANVDALGALRMLEAIRILGMETTCRFYQASTSELYGDVAETPQTELTPFRPRSPYACAKLYAYWITNNYREAYGMYACNGVLFNHESPLRGETFVTRKVTRAVARIALIRKMHDAKRRGETQVTLWGTGTPLREFLHSDDLADAALFLAQADDGILDPLFQEHKPPLVNVGYGKEVSICDLARKVARAVGFVGAIQWDTTQPNGTPRKLLDSTLIRSLGWQPSTTLDSWIDAAYADFLQGSERL